MYNFAIGVTKIEDVNPNLQKTKKKRPKYRNGRYHNPHNQLVKFNFSYIDYGY